MDSLQVKQAYDRCAAFYDGSTRLYPLVGFRFNQYRKLAICRLNLQPGDHVLDLGCGTGLNFSFFQELIGPQGRITGVDFSSGMLNRARQRVHQAGWENVELIQSDMQEVTVPFTASAVFSSGALGFLPDPAAFVARIMEDLPAHCAFGMLDLKQPDRWPRWLFHLFFTLSGKPFAVTPQYVMCRPCPELEFYLKDPCRTEHYGGAVYIATGRKAG
jgi:demethylmenaquinone methyltransferase/2-methoxy-6-polyprenyl-1,4-benzoquinol methylase